MRKEKNLKRQHFSMLKPAKQKPVFPLKKEVSWSFFSSFRDYDKEEWYQHYIMGKPTPLNPEMAFGSKVGKSFETNKPMAKVTRYKIMEKEIHATSMNGVRIWGYLDSYRPKDSDFCEVVTPDGKRKKVKVTLSYKRSIREFKTGKKGKNQWSQKRADKHDQITFYCLLVYLTEGIRPEEIELNIDWYPTTRDKRYKVCFVDDIDNQIQTFTTTRTLSQLIKFDSEISKVYKEMQEYVKNHK